MENREIAITMDLKQLSPSDGATAGSKWPEFYSLL